MLSRLFSGAMTGEGVLLFYIPKGITDAAMGGESGT